MHGGRAPRGRDHHAFKHGHYSTYLRDEDGIDYEEFCKQFSTTDISEEMKVAVFRSYRASLDSGDHMAVLRAVDRISRVKLRHLQSLEGTTVYVDFTDDDMRQLLGCIDEVLSKHVEDPDTRRRIMESLHAVAWGDDPGSAADGDE